MTVPITPREVRENLVKPDDVFNSFNELIMKHWDGTEAKFSAEEVTKLIAAKMKMDPRTIGANYLLVDRAYANFGWYVSVAEKDFCGTVFTFIPTESCLNWVK